MVNDFTIAVTYIGELQSNSKTGDNILSVRRCYMTATLWSWVCVCVCVCDDAGTDDRINLPQLLQPCCRMDDPGTAVPACNAAAADD